ncbi:MAG: archease [archaeon]
MKYKLLEGLTSDVMFEAYGSGLKELFANCAEALFSIMCSIEDVGGDREVEVSVSGDDEEALLHNWLSELLTRADTEEIFLKRFEVREIGGEPLSLKAVCYGEAASVEKGRTYIKAVTYYKFRIEKTAKGYKATVALDI